MKVLVYHLAFLLIFIVLLPYLISSCTLLENNNENIKITVFDHLHNTNFDCELEEYIVSVLSAEMPASFEKEALKAQAVAARTYALRKIKIGSDEHSGADLCTNYAHCQAYATDGDLKEKWGNDYKFNIKKIKSAVKDTAGEYISYNNDFAIAVFHSCSNGITEKSSDVWGGDIPYLINVLSPGDYEKNNYENKIKVSKEEFIEKIGISKDNILQEYENPIGDIIYSQGNNVTKIKIFDKEYTGTEIRNLFNLDSTAFTLENKGDYFLFTVCGSGHGVGMSQYGANYMAKNNKDYTDIISHYYPGTKIMDLYD